MLPPWAGLLTTTIAPHSIRVGSQSLEQHTHTPSIAEQGRAEQSSHYKGIHSLPYGRYKSPAHHFPHYNYRPVEHASEPAPAPFTPSTRHSFLIHQIHPSSKRCSSQPSHSSHSSRPSLCSLGLRRLQSVPTGGRRSQISARQE